MLFEPDDPFVPTLVPRFITLLVACVLLKTAASPVASASVLFIER